jgi:hypothetical protein
VPVHCVHPGAKGNAVLHNTNSDSNKFDHLHEVKVACEHGYRVNKSVGSFNLSCSLDVEGTTTSWKPTHSNHTECGKYPTEAAGEGWGTGNRRLR